MYISRVVIRNFRNFAHLDIPLQERVSCIIGENNTGKTNLLHAIRLVLDNNLSSQYRTLSEQDIHSGISIQTPEQVVISVELRGYKDTIKEVALVGTAQVEDDLARITFRFRPNASIRDTIDSGEPLNRDLTLEDYKWEIVGGGDKDPADVRWDEHLGSNFRVSDLQSFCVEYLPALRDVQQSMRQSRVSPLGRLISESEMSADERATLVEILRTANQQIAASPQIGKAGAAVNSSFADAAGDAFPMDIRVGMSDPSFSSISRSLTLLLSNDALSDFDPGRNGLGLNNILYVSMLLEYFERRLTRPNVAGQLLLVEEPEAHLHPQLQRVLYAALENKDFQTILTTHSTHISSHAPLKSYVVLTNDGVKATQACSPVVDAALSKREEEDLQRYLDATRSTLLFARKVLLVEGPAELFLIPVLAKEVIGIDLDRWGISVVPIHGTHFGSYARLFSECGIKKKCAIIADGDMSVKDVADEDEPLSVSDLHSLENSNIRVFQCPTTFERALVIREFIPVLRKTAEECGATRTVAALKAAEAGTGDIPEEVRGKVLRLAERVGKARFALIASKHVNSASGIPEYIRDAIVWLL